MIAQAWRDTFDYSPAGDKQLDWQEKEIGEARRFLLSRDGPWAESRHQVCALADVDPEALRERALAEQARHWSDT